MTANLEENGKRMFEAIHRVDAGREKEERVLPLVNIGRQALRTVTKHDYRPSKYSKCFRIERGVGVRLGFRLVYFNFQK